MSDNLEVDLAIIGAGSAGETIATYCAAGGLRVALIEAGLVGGECPYYACIPTKSLLFSAAAGESWSDAIALREQHVQFRDDRSAVNRLQSAGVILVRGQGKLETRNSVRVQQPGDNLLINAVDIVIATGSEPITPTIPGLDPAFTWTSDQALSSAELPRRIAIIGGGPVGCELAQIYSRFGAKVALIESSERLLAHEAEFISAQLQEALQTEGTDIRTSTQVVGAQAREPGVELHLTRGPNLAVDRVLLAVGRRPRVDHLDLARIGMDPTVLAAGLRTDDFGALRPGLWAAGDVTGDTPFTHAANYQARAIAANILGQDYRMNLSAIPRGVYTEPAVLAVGEAWDAESAQRGLIRAGFDVENTARGFLAGQISGRVELYADLSSGVVVGAAGIGPGIDEVLGQAILAVRLGVSIGAWADVVQPFPTYSEVYGEILRDLDRQRAERLQRYFFTRGEETHRAQAV